MPRTSLSPQSYRRSTTAVGISSILWSTVLWRVKPGTAAPECSGAIFLHPPDPGFCRTQQRRYFDGIRQTLEAILELEPDETTVDNDAYERETDELL